MGRDRQAMAGIGSMPWRVARPAVGRRLRGAAASVGAIGLTTLGFATLGVVGAAALASAVPSTQSFGLVITR